MHGETVRLSDFSEEKLKEAPQTASIKRLTVAEEVWVAPDNSDSRKPHAEQMESIIQVRDLKGKLVPGYRVLNALFITPGARGLPYHRLLSSQEADFKGEPHEHWEAVRSGGHAFWRIHKPAAVTPLLDQAFDDQALWGVKWEQEDAFKFINQSLGREEVQLLSLEAMRSLVALAAVGAGFFFEWGVSLEWQAVRLLARLGGWIPRKNAKPDDIILTCVLRRLLDMSAARSILDDYLNQLGSLPPQVAAFPRNGFCVPKLRTILGGLQNEEDAQRGACTRLRSPAFAVRSIMDCLPRIGCWQELLPEQFTGDEDAHNVHSSLCANGV